MNCQIAQNLLSAYLDRELPGDQMIALRSHVERCNECSTELESLRALKSDLATLPSIEIRSGFSQDVMRLVREEPAQSPAPRLPLPLMVATSVAAAVLAVLLFNAFFGGRPHPQVANDGTGFDAASDSAVTSPEFGSTAPLIPVGR